jgi:ABC-type multidrug transport system fused ATPase/permease subunit
MISSPSKWYSYFWLNHSYYLFVFIIIGLIGSATLGYFTPVVISDLFNSYGKVDFLDKIYILGFLFVGEYLNRAIYQGVVTLYIKNLLKDVRHKTYSNWLHCYESIEENKKNAERYPLGEVISRMISDAEAIQEMVGSGGFSIFLDLLYIGFSLISFINLNTNSGVYLIILEVLVCLFLFWISKIMARQFMEVRKSTGIMSRILANLTSGFREIYFTKHFHYSLKRSQKSFDDFLQKQLKANIFDAGYYSFAESLFPWFLAFLIFIFPYSQITELAIIAAVIDLIQRSINPIKDTASKISTIQRAKTGIERIQEFNRDLVSWPTSNNETEATLEFKELKVKIDEFCYGENSEFKIQNINFQASQGNLIGIVGLSGSGKSTLLKILATEILCPKAKIEIISNQNQNLVLDSKNSLKLNYFKKHISLVSQESHIFSDSLRFNLTMGIEKDFDEFFNSCCVQIPYLKKWGINLDDKIIPKNLSLGQKQLVAAIRSLYLKKPIVLFDEIASGLDSDLEEALSMMTKLLSQNSLTITVAHRIETITHAQKILLLDKGKLVDQGLHQELSQRSALYQDFISQLQKGH